MYFTALSHYTMKSMLNVTKKSNLIKLCLVIISALELKSTSKKAFIINSTKTFWFFSEFLCSISSSHFQSFNFTSAFNR